MWHYPTAGQKKSEGGCVPKGARGSERSRRFREEQEAPRETGGSERGGRFRERREVPRETGGSERSRRFQRQGFPRRCFGGDASGVLQRKCLEGDALGCSGKLKETKKIQSNKVKQKKHLRLCLQSTITISRANVQSSA